MKRKYQITKACVACGACKTICPKHCISKGRPYVIQAQNCIGCGLCVSRCWRNVIIPLDVEKLKDE